jgi:hypothetical protein
MITETQIRDQLFSYLIRQITLNDFEDWLVQQSWNMHQDSDDAAQRLVGAIELRLAEYSDDHLTDDALERELKGLIAPSVFVLFENARPIQPVVTGSTASESSRVDWSVSQAV